MDQGKSLLRGVIASPYDDAPRLVYADWLEEHGQPERAEFIRGQIELARLPVDDDRRVALERREKQLRDQYRKQWLRPLSRLARWAFFHRGFPDHLYLPAKHFVEEAEGILAQLPVCYAHFRTAKPHLAALADCPALSHMRSLSFYYNQISPAGLGALLASPYLGKLVRLDLGNCRLNDQAAGVLAAARLPRLRELRLGQNRVGDEGVAALAAGRLLRGLEQLDLSHNQVGVEGARALADSPHVAGLTSLVLNDNAAIDDGGVEALAASPHLANLTRLELSGINQPDWRTERHRGLSRAGMAALAASPHLNNLTALNVSNNALVGQSAVSVLAATKALLRLTVLDLSDCWIGPRGCSTLAASPLLARLTALNLGGAGAGNGGARALAQSPRMAGLRSLNLCGGPLAEKEGVYYEDEVLIGDAGAKALAASPHAAGLRVLDLSFNAIGRPGALALAASPHLTSLVSLVLHNNSLEEDEPAQQALRERFGPDVCWL
jgi:uncharacterized protein (TIGR02996 family)